VIRWRSSAPAVARVDEEGFVTALAPGTATITATDGAVSGSQRVSVIAGVVASVELTASPRNPRVRAT
jgi:uncharacterized protein YjdB